MVCCVAFARGAAAQTPELLGASVLALRPGGTTTITWTGANLQSPLGLWTSFGARHEFVAPAPGKDGKPAPADPKRLASKLTLAPGVPLGVGFVRVATENGFSMPFFLLVDELRLVERSGTNSTAERAQMIDLPVAVEGNTDAGRADFYQFKLKAGEGVSVEVFAARLLTKCDPRIRLLDAGGAELATADDTPGLAGDCRLRHRARADSTVILEVRDASWLGGADRRYHVRIGDFPLVSAAFPPAAKPGESVDARAFGESAEGVEGVLVRGAVAPRISGESVMLPVRFAPEKPSAFVPFRAEALPFVVARESSNSAAGAAMVTAPEMIFGRFARPGARDVFRLAARKGERFALTPVTRSLGSPAMLYIAVEDGQGTFIASNEVAGKTPATELPLVFTATEERVYRVVVEELTRRGGPAFTYGLRVERADRGMELGVGGERFVSARGGTFTVKVTAQRRAVSGPITLSIADAEGRALPEGFAVSDNVIEAGKNETLLKITVPEELSAGPMHVLSIIGRAMDGTNAVSAIAAPPAPNPATPKDPLLPLLALPSIPRVLRETIAVCVTPRLPAVFAVNVAEPVIGLPRLIGRREFVVAQKPVAKGFAGVASLAFAGLPKDVSIAVESPAKSKAGVASHRCIVTGPAAKLVGEHRLTLTVTAEHAGMSYSVQLTNLVLRGIEPLAIRATAAGAFAPGAAQKIKITVTRFGDAADAQPISLRVKNLPPGISAPESASIDAAKDTAEIEIKADETAKPGVRPGLVFVATTAVKGEKVSVESEPVAVSVKGK